MFILKPSFAGGELSPALYGRTDLAKYDNGASELTNFIVLRYGGVSNRPGTKFISETANNKKARLVPFKYSSSENYVIEITAGKFRFYTNGAPVLYSYGAPYEVANNFTENELETIKYTQSADVIFLVQANHFPMTLTRYGVNNWVFETMDITGGPFEDGDYKASAKSNITITPSGTNGTITLNASAPLFNDGDVNTLMRLSYYVESQYKKGNPLNNTSLEVSVLPQSSVYVESFGFWNGSFVLQKYDTSKKTWMNVRSQDGNRSQNYNFVEKNEADEIVRYRVTSSEFDTSVWTNENEKQRGYVTIQSFGNDYDAQVLIRDFISPTEVGAVVKVALPSTASTKDFTFSSWSKSKGYPQAVGFFEDRLIFAGSRSKPQTFWASKTGDYYNFGTSIPSTDDDSIIATVNGGQMNGVKAIISFGEMILLTSGGEYKVSGNNKAISPTNVTSQAQEYRGISDVNPITVGSRIVYVQEQGGIIRDLAYSYDVDKYTGDDLNLLATHLFDGYKIVDMAYQQTPDSIVWCVRSDGILLGLTYLKEQDVFAWHRHETKGGKFISVCTISGATQDELWVVVERGGKRYVELMEVRDLSGDVSSQYFVDCGVKVKNNTKPIISGLNHLEGHEVSILADGFVLPRQVVKNGQVDLKHVYSMVNIGLPITSQLQTMPIEFTGQDGSYQSRKKRIAQLMMFFKDSRGGRFGTQEDLLDEIKWRSTEKWGEAIELYTGKKKLTIPHSGWSETVKVVVRQEDPLPITVLSVVPSVEAGG